MVQSTKIFIEENVEYKQRCSAPKYQIHGFLIIPIITLASKTYFLVSKVFIIYNLLIFK